LPYIVPENTPRLLQKVSTGTGSSVVDQSDDGSAVAEVVDVVQEE